MNISFSQFVAAYLAGFISSLTPCVYPLIPITISLFGINSDTSRLRAFSLSATYVLGICLSYCTLGIISAKLGLVFGSLLANIWFVLGASAFLLLLAAYTLDILKIPFIHTLQTKAGCVKKKGFTGAFIMGALSGVVAAPCVGPALVNILAQAALSKSVYFSALLLFSYSLGLGTLFLLLGTFAGLLERMPRSGNWLFLIKMLIAASLIYLALSFSYPFTKGFFTMFLSIPLSIILISLALAATYFIQATFRHHKVLHKSIGTTCLALAVFFAFNLESSNSEENSVWLRDLDSGLKRAHDTHTLVVIDLFADWCGACKELERLTFSDPRVMSKLKEFTLVRLDFTLENDNNTQFAQKYNVLGLPWILFLNADGNEIKDCKITGFVEPKEILERLEKVKNNNSC